MIVDVDGKELKNNQYVIARIEGDSNFTFSGKIADINYGISNDGNNIPMVKIINLKDNTTWYKFNKNIKVVNESEFMIWKLENE